MNVVLFCKKGRKNRKGISTTIKICLFKLVMRIFFRDAVRGAKVSFPFTDNSCVIIPCDCVLCTERKIKQSNKQTKK